MGSHPAGIGRRKPAKRLRGAKENPEARPRTRRAGGSRGWPMRAASMEGETPRRCRARGNRTTTRRNRERTKATIVSNQKTKTRSESRKRASNKKRMPIARKVTRRRDCRDFCTFGGVHAPKPGSKTRSKTRGKTPQKTIPKRGSALIYI